MVTSKPILDMQVQYAQQTHSLYHHCKSHKSHQSWSKVTQRIQLQCLEHAVQILFLQFLKLILTLSKPFHSLQYSLNIVVQDG